MCGIFGFVSMSGNRPSLKRLQEIAVETERRGRHAFGFAWIDSAGRLRAYKQTGPISKSLDVLSIAADARMLIGHCRYATQGSYHNNLNNHPHPVDGGWLVHNGVVQNYHGLIAEHDLYPVTECDSELIGLLIEDLAGSMMERCAEAANIAAPDNPFAMMGLWRSPHRMTVVRKGQPLSMGIDKSGDIYLASLTKGLPAGNRSVPDNAVLSFLRRGDSVEQQLSPIASLVS